MWVQRVWGHPCGRCPTLIQRATGQDVRYKPSEITWSSINTNIITSTCAKNTHEIKSIPSVFDLMGTCRVMDAFQRLIPFSCFGFLICCDSFNHHPVLVFLLSVGRRGAYHFLVCYHLNTGSHRNTVGFSLWLPVSKKNQSRT